MTPGHDQPVVFTPPGELSDEAAVMLVKTLNEIVTAVEQRYAAQLCRYQARPDDDQLDLWSDPPF